METLKLNSTYKTDVMLLQSTLKKLGYYNSAIDGIFGKNTENAVIRFQRDFGLTQDGIVGPKTFEKLMPYINGYANYKIKQGDTELYAKQYMVISKKSPSNAKVFHINFIKHFLWI